MTIDPALTAGLILAGGRATRMGGRDKALLPLRDKPLIAHVAARLRPQVGRLFINANGDPDRFAPFGLPVIADPIGDHWGPLAGILAGLEYLARHRPESSWMVSVAVDTPFFPEDLVARLAHSLDGIGDLAMARGGGRRQPVFALWPVRLAPLLREALQGGLRGAEAFAEQFQIRDVDWPEEAFFNINAPEDLAQASRRL